MRRGLKVVLGILLTLVLLLVLLPFWLGPVLRPAARHWGLDIGGYERAGYSRLVLTNVTYTRPGVTVTAKRAETDTPLLWGWRKLSGRGSATTAEHWTVVVTERDPSERRTPSGQFGLVQLHALLNRIAPALDHWLPNAVVTDGEVRWPRGGLKLTEAAWKQSALTFRGLQWPYGSADGKIAFAADHTISVDATQGTDLAAHLRWLGSGREAAGEFSVWSQPLPVSAHFAEHGWLPADGKADATNWTVAASRIGLGGQYGDLHGDAHASWADGNFRVTTQASAAPLKEGGLPPLNLQAEAQGDRETWTISALHLVAPFATVELSQPVTLGFDGRVRSGPAQLTFQTDLAQQSWVAVRGRGKGEIRLTAGAGEPISAAFTGDWEDLSWGEVTAQRASTAGSLAWPRLQLDRLEIVADANSRATVQGAYDFKAKVVEDGKAEGRLTQAWVQPWLPGGLTFDGVDFKLTAKGPLAELEHTGEASAAKIQFAPVKPVSAKATWEGHGRDLPKVAVQVAAGSTTLDAAGAFQGGKVTVQSLRFAPGGSEAWTLEAPATVELAPNVRVAGLHLRGPTSRVAADFTGGGNSTMALELEQFDARWLADLLDVPGPSWQLQHLKFTGGLQDGKLKFDLAARALLALTPQPAQVALVATGDGTGVRLTQLQMVEGDRVLAQAQGRLPLVWNQQAQPHVQFDLDAPLDFHATTEPSSPLWAALGDSFGLDLGGPTAQIELSGSGRRPVGVLRLAVERIALEKGRTKFSLPAIEKLAVTAHADRDQLSLDQLSAQIDGQPLQASGRLPLGDARWQQLMRDRQNFDWSQAEARLDVAGAELAPFARYAPDYLATQGKLEMHAAFSKGNFSGDLKLRDAATRPLPALGIVQEISTDVSLDGRIVNVRSFTGKLGGQPVTLQGSIELPKSGAPHYHLTLKGSSVPLVRRAGVLVRSDLDLKAETDNAGETRLSGVVNVTDGLVLSDLRSLLPTGARGVSRPPPYFAIEAEPFASWPLSVQLRAASTVRLRSAIFNGTASAHFLLEGTLGAPRATGEASIDEGEVVFPFVTFTVQLGTVRLTPANPYEPQLNVTAVARRYGYDVHMEAKGSAESPQLSFTANPALASEQVLLMVMAGQPPAENLVASTGGQRLTRIGAYVGEGLIKEFGGEGLELSSGERVSEKGHETYQLEYTLNPKWSVVGEYDEFDQFNAGLKWRFYTGGKKRESK
jgi:translocation and assembly module TamB